MCDTRSSLSHQHTHTDARPVPTVCRASRACAWGADALRWRELRAPVPPVVRAVQGAPIVIYDSHTLQRVLYLPPCGVCRSFGTVWFYNKLHKSKKKFTTLIEYRALTPVRAPLAPPAPAVAAPLALAGVHRTRTPIASVCKYEIFNIKVTPL